MDERPYYDTAKAAEYLTNQRGVRTAPQTLAKYRSIGGHAGDFVAGGSAKRVDHPEIAGDAVEQYQRRTDHQPAIAFCATVTQAGNVAEAFRLPVTAPSAFMAACNGRHAIDWSPASAPARSRF